LKVGNGDVTPPPHIPQTEADPIAMALIPTRRRFAADARTHTAAGFSLVSLFILLFALRLISEGIDLLLGTPFSVAITIAIIGVSIAALFMHGQIARLALTPLVLGLCFFATSIVSWLFSPLFEGLNQFEVVVKYFFYPVIFLLASSLPWKAKDLTLLVLLIAITTLSGIARLVFQPIRD
jgi:hypothetical protein